VTDVELNYDLHVLGLEHRLMATLEDGKLLWRQHASTTRNFLFSKDTANGRSGIPSSVVCQTITCCGHCGAGRTVLLNSSVRNVPLPLLPIIFRWRAQLRSEGSS